jgi:hypothetical protein
MDANEQLEYLPVYLVVARELTFWPRESAQLLWHDIRYCTSPMLVIISFWLPVI